MLEVKDKNSNTLYMHDKIRHEFTTEHGDEKEVEGIVIAFTDEESVQYQPVGKGLPVICRSFEVVQVDSLAQRVMSLKTDVDFQELIKTAGERYLAEVKVTKKKKGGKKAASSGQIDSSILDALAGMKKKK